MRRARDLRQKKILIKPRGYESSWRGWSYHLGTAHQKNTGSASNVWVWHQPTELDTVKSNDAAAAATARCAGEAALRNATNTTTKDTATTAAAGVRDGPSPLEPPATDVGA